MILNEEYRLKVGLAEMLKGGVIMDVVTPEQAVIAERAGHRAIAEMMIYTDHSGEPELERLEAERRAEARRSAAQG